jgi:hypothetical protein
MPTPKPKYEEPAALKQAWKAIEGVNRVQAAAVLADTMVHGEIFVQIGNVTMDLAAKLLEVAHFVLDVSITSFGVIIDDGRSEPVDFRWSLENGWRSSKIIQFHARRQQRREDDTP